jgi:hypothetical protein
MFQTKVKARIKTIQIIFNIFFFKNPAFYEVMWKNVVEPDTDVNVAHAFCCWTNNAPETHSEYTILIAFTRQHWLSERASMLRFYVDCVSSLS